MGAATIVREGWQDRRSLLKPTSARPHPDRTGPGYFYLHRHLLAATGAPLLGFQTSPLGFQTSPLEFQTSPLRFQTSPLRSETSRLRFQTSPLGFQTPTENSELRWGVVLRPLSTVRRELFAVRWVQDFSIKRSTVKSRTWESGDRYPVLRITFSGMELEVKQVSAMISYT